MFAFFLQPKDEKGNLIKKGDKLKKDKKVGFVKNVYLETNTILIFNLSEDILHALSFEQFIKSGWIKIN